MENNDNIQLAVENVKPTGLHCFGVGLLSNHLFAKIKNETEETVSL
jgi:hypothetical protein